MPVRIREPTRIISAIIYDSDYKVLKSNKINISDLIREYVRDYTKTLKSPLEKLLQEKIELSDLKEDIERRTKINEEQISLYKTEDEKTKQLSEEYDHRLKLLKKNLQTVHDRRKRYADQWIYDHIMLVNLKNVYPGVSQTKATDFLNQFDNWKYITDEKVKEFTDGLQEVIESE